MLMLQNYINTYIVRFFMLKCLKYFFLCTLGVYYSYLLQQIYSAAGGS